MNHVMHIIRDIYERQRKTKMTKGSMVPTKSKQNLQSIKKEHYDSTGTHSEEHSATITDTRYISKLNLGCVCTHMILLMLLGLSMCKVAQLQQWPHMLFGLYACLTLCHKQLRVSEQLSLKFLFTVFPRIVSALDQ